MKKVICTNNAPAAVGPYSQGVEVNGTLYVSGQIPFIPKTMSLVSEDVRVQTRQSLLNIKAILLFICIWIVRFDFSPVIVLVSWSQDNFKFNASKMGLIGTITL